MPYVLTCDLTALLTISMIDMKFSRNFLNIKLQVFEFLKYLFNVRRIEHPAPAVAQKFP